MSPLDRARRCVFSFVSSFFCSAAFCAGAASTAAFDPAGAPEVPSVVPVPAELASGQQEGEAKQADPVPTQRQLDEAAWRSPTPERMALPPLMPWQRNLDDALAVQKRTGQPILICVNMDGERACDALAAWRYRDPAFAALASGYVCLVVSPDDHQPREYDDRGRRMVSPRLGRVTDREHIDLEPELFARYFKDYRVAPRHVAVAPDGTVLFDVYLINDPSLLDAQLREHAKPVEALDFTGMEASELSGYPDALAREEMERRMLDGNTEERLALAAFVGAHPDAGMVGLRDPDSAVREAVALELSRRAAGLDAVQSRRLVEAVAALAPESRAKAMVQLSTLADGGAVSATSLRAMDPTAAVSSLGAAADWRAAASLSTLERAPVVGRDDALAALERLDEEVAPDAANAAQAFLRATALLQLAQSLLEGGEDPRDAAAEAAVFARQAAEVDPWRTSAIEAVALGLAGDYSGSVRAARLALPSLWMVPSDPLNLATLRALRVGATQLVYGQINAKEPVARALVADAVLAGRTLLAHTAGTEGDATGLLDLVGAVGDAVREPKLIQEALVRFPASAELHRRFRVYVLRTAGAASMGPRYDELEGAVSAPGYGPTLAWFRGLGLLVAAEWELGQGDQPAGAAAYEASIAAFQASADEEPAFLDSSLHYQVLGHAGAASLAADMGQLESAAEHLQAAATLRPASLELKDGLGLTPRERAVAVLPALLPTLDEEHQAAFLRVFPAAGPK